MGIDIVELASLGDQTRPLRARGTVADIYIYIYIYMYVRTHTHAHTRLYVRLVLLRIADVSDNDNGDDDANNSNIPESIFNIHSLIISIYIVFIMAITMIGTNTDGGDDDDDDDAILFSNTPLFFSVLLMVGVGGWQQVGVSRPPDGRC